MINRFNTLITTYQEELAKYTTKPTKASSKRLRGLITDIQKTTVSAKRDLIALDVEGY